MPSSCFALPSGNSLPRAKPNYGKQTQGVSHDAPFLSDKSDRSDKSDTSVTPPRHAHHRSHQVARHTTEATLRPSQTTQRHLKPSGYTETPHTPLPLLTTVNHRFASVTPPQTAYRRCHQVARHTTEATFSPAPYHTAASKPSGYNMTCRGVARQGEDGRPLFVRQVRQVRQVRHKRHATATRTPP